MVKKAFTLIELLVVIAIISLLVSILLPSLKTAQDLAKSVTCLSQMKNFGYAINEYLDENNRSLPKLTLSYYDSIMDYVQLMDPYLGNEDTKYHWGSANPNPNKIWQCTADEKGDNLGFEAKYHGSSYNYAWQYGGQSIDSGIVSSYVYEGWAWRWEDSQAAEAPLMFDLYTHTKREMQNVIFADMHAESYPYKEWEPWYPAKG